MRRLNCFLVILGVLGFLSLAGNAQAQRTEVMTLPTSANLGQSVTADMSGLIFNTDYELDWGDGSSDPFTVINSTNLTKSLSHTYSSATSFTVNLFRLQAAGTKTAVQTKIITIIALTITCNLALTPDPTIFGDNTTAQIKGLPAATDVSVDWGDKGSSDVYTSNAQGDVAGKHTFASTGTFVVVVSTVAGASPSVVACQSTVNVSIPTPSLNINPSSVDVGVSTNASLGNLLPNVNYLLDWGDGSSDPVTGVSSSNLTHVYSSTGVKQVKLTVPSFPSVPPVIVPVTVTLPTCTLNITPNPVNLGSTSSVNVTGLPAGLSVNLDWGDGTPQSANTTKADGSFADSHVYANTGTFVVKTFYSNGNGTAQLLCQTTAQVVIPTPTLNVNPLSVSINQDLTATIGNLLPNVNYSLDWGDNTIDSVTGVSSSILSHAYSSIGAKFVRLIYQGAAPIIVPVTVTLPTCNLDLSPNPVNLGADLIANVTGLPFGMEVRFDWGDGSIPTTDTVRAGGILGSAHVYLAKGTFVVKVLYGAANSILCQSTVQVIIPIPSLDVAPLSVTIAQPTTANIANLLSSVTYSLAWGDGSTDSISGQTKIKLSHAYSSAGIKQVKLSYLGGAPIIVPITVTLPTCTLELTPNPVNLGASFTAKALGLPSGLDVTLNWGDGSQNAQTVKADGTFSDTHNYAKVAVFTVKVVYATSGAVAGTVLCQGVVSVQVPSAVETLNANPSTPKANQTVKLEMGNLLKDPLYAYQLDFGDSTSEAVSVKADGTASVLHTYPAVKVYVVTLRLVAAGSPTLIRATLSLQTTAPFKLTDLNLEFSQPVVGKNIQVKQDDLLEATLSFAYTQAGILNGNFTLDGVIFSSESIELTAGKTTGVFKLNNLPSNVLGTHILKFEVTSLESDGVTLGASALATAKIVVASFDVTPKVLPTTLNIGGFVFEVKSITNASILNFSGKGTHELIVGGMLAKKLEVSFQNLIVTIAGDVAIVKTGQIDLNFSPALEIASPIGLGAVKLSLTKLLFATSGAKVSGFATMPNKSGGTIPLPQGINFTIPDLNSAAQAGPVGKSPMSGAEISQSYANVGLIPFVPYGPPIPSKTFIFSNQDLKPVSGDLYASGVADTLDFKIGKTGVTLNGQQAAILDLSLAISPDQLAEAYSATSTPPDISAAWVGIFFPSAQLQPSDDIKLEIGKPFYNLLGQQGAYSSLPNLPVAYHMGAYSFYLKLGIGNAKVKGWQMHINNLELGVYQNEVVTSSGSGKLKVPFLEEDLNNCYSFQPGGSWSITTVGTIKHDFGRSVLLAGAASFNDNNQLVFPDAVWAITNLVSENSPANPHGSSFNGGNVATAGLDGKAGSSYGKTNDPAQKTTLASSSCMAGFYANQLAPVASNNFDNNGNLIAKSAIKLPLSNLTITNTGDVFLASPAGVASVFQGLIGGGDIKILGFKFPSTQIGIGKVGDQYFIGLKGKEELGQGLPAIVSELDYYIKNGKNLEIVVFNAGFNKKLNASTKIKVEPAERHLPLTSGSNLLAGKNANVLNAKLGNRNLKALEPPKADFKDTGDGWELVISAGIEVGEGADKFKVLANALFGNKKSINTGYWYVFADVENAATPFFTLFETLNLHGFFGGVAYHMSWATNGSVKSFQKPPKFDKNTPLQITAGIVLALEKGDRFHTAGVLSINFGGEVAIIADGWFFTPLSDGYFGNKSPQARASIKFNSDGFTATLCVGPSDPPGDSINCSDLEKLSLYGVATVYGYAELHIGGDNTYLYVGDFYSRVTVNVLDLFESDGFLMIGYMLPGNKPPQAQTGGFQYWTGAHIRYSYQKQGSGNIICNYDWHFSAGFESELIFGIAFLPKFSLDASGYMHAWAEVGGHFCGLGGTIGADVYLSGEMHIPNPTYVDGTAEVYVYMPFIIPDIHLKVHAHIVL